MKSVTDRMTPEQRARFDAMVARKLAAPPRAGAHCAYCDQFISNFEPNNEATWEALLASGRVPVPNFGWFCSHACADAFERDYGIHFRRDQSGRVSYD